MKRHAFTLMLRVTCSSHAKTSVQLTVPLAEFRGCSNLMRCLRRLVGHLVPYSQLVTELQSCKQVESIVLGRFVMTSFTQLH